jgi:hypothetical protein
MKWEQVWSTSSCKPPCRVKNTDLKAGKFNRIFAQ